MRLSACLLLAFLSALSPLAEAVTVTVDRSVARGPVKPVNGVGQPPMVGALSSWKLMPYLKEAGIPYSRLHDVGGRLGGGLYVDIPNLFPDFSADETDPANYRFDATDSLCHALERNGVEPFFRLGVTIENFVRSGIARRHTEPPTDFGKWARICEHVIRHYTEGWADGLKMKIAYWEIWNEPDNEPEPEKNSMWGASFDEFLRFYGVVAPYLKAKFPVLKIGGYGSCGFYAGVGADGIKAANSSPRTEYFVRCAERFLEVAHEEGWPLDFFSYHSYSNPTEALRQVAFANALLNRYGFTSDKTARVFNEWLPYVAQENLGTAKQAAGIAAELIGLQNGPCDIACLYDARCNVGSYSPLFNPLTCKPHKAYEAFLAFNELRKLGTAVACMSSDPSVRAAAAAKDGKLALMIANDSTEEKPVTFRGVSEFAVACVTDATCTRARIALPSVLPPQSIMLVQDGGEKLSDWRLDKCSRIEGDLLVVDVPAGAHGGAARRKIDLTKFPKGVECHIRCRGENVTKPEESWLGTKFMLHFTDGDGVEQWPGATQKSGTFDWCEMRFAKGLSKGAKNGEGELTLGLQNASGKIVFDLSSLKIVERQDSWTVPADDRDYRCVYTPEVAHAPRKRGVMLPSGKCKEDDFKTLQKWGATLVRYQMCRNWTKENDNRDLGEYDRWLAGKLDHLDHDVLPWAEKYGLSVVVDLHSLPGGRAQSDLNMFYEKPYADHFIACWQKIARRFKGRKNIYGYDLVNEPNQQFAALSDGDYWALQRRAAEAVRAIDPEVTIVIESNGWDAPKAFEYLRPLRLTNVVYQAHMYQPMAFTHQGVSGVGERTPTRYPDPSKGWDRDFLRRQLAEVRMFQQTHGAKIYIGEFSAIAWAEGAEAYLRDVISIFEEYGWDWSYHAFREWPGWSVEHEGPDASRLKPSADNPRKHALLDGLRTKPN